MAAREGRLVYFHACNYLMKREAECRLEEQTVRSDGVTKRSLDLLKGEGQLLYRDGKNMKKILQHEEMSKGGGRRR